MTFLSRQMYDTALTLHNTADAARVLLEYKQYRTFADVLQGISGGIDLRRTLIEGLLKWNPDDIKESVERKVRNWLAGKNQSITKEDAFVLSRVLRLPLDKADEFMKMTTGEGIHWRDPEEIVWCYAIAQRLEPEKTRQLLSLAVNLRESKAALQPGSYTSVIYEKLQPILYGPEEELLAFLEQERENLGVFHNTAYRIFDRFMTLLEKGFSEGDVEARYKELSEKEKRQRAAERKEAESPGPGGDLVLRQPEKISSRQVLETYLYRNLVPAKDRGGASKSDPFVAIRRSIRQSWPDESNLSRMRNRKIDVTRKVLILLFLATDGSSTAYDEKDEDEVLETEEEIFLDIYTRLNLMLSSCGFQKLDPRSAFDWMILFCISSGDLWESDKRLRAMLGEMFQEEDAE